jgi:hypothetical protein
LKIIAFIIAALISLPAAAQVFLEVGIGAVIDNRSYHCISDYRNTATRAADCSDNPLGSIAAGYMYKGFSLEIEHKSSLVEKDRGLDTVFAKYRYVFD